jgi:predicted GIY-YIG superfamily endonuclease
MPRKIIDYSKTIIYKIVSKDLDNNYIYVGSTTDFPKRKSAHKCSCTKENTKFYNFKVYKMIRENGGWNEFEMLEIEKYPCNDKNECLARERYWKEYFNANMNTRIPGLLNELGIQEYHKQPHILEYNKKYYINNIEKIHKFKNKKFNCVCGGKHTYANRHQHFKSQTHQNYLDNLLNNHDHNMKQIDTFLDDIQNFINNLK